MPRFSIKVLLVAMTLVAGGMGLIYFAFQHPNLRGDETLQLAGGWLGGGVLIGAGMFTLFGKPWFGAIIGFALALAIPLLGTAIH
jgi:hypothetical protein